jgi:lipoprotein NlpD
MFNRWLALAALTLLVGCATQPRAPVEDRDLGVGTTGTLERTAGGDVYTVVRGDTLYAISFRVGLDYRELAEFNGIGDPYTIYPGQRLKIPGGASEPASVASAPVRTTTPPAPAQTAPVVERSFEPQPLPDEPGTASTQPLDPAAPKPGQLITEPVAPATAAGARVGLSVPPSGATPTTTPSAPKLPATASTTPTAPPAAAVATGGWRWPTEGRVIGTFAAGDPGRKGVDISGQIGQTVVAANDGEVVYSGEGLIGYGQLIIIKHSNALLSAYGHNRKRLVKEGDRVKGGQPIAEMGATNGAQPALHFEIRQGGKPVDPLRYLPRR